MKLWEKGINPEPAIIEFTSGRDRKTDLHLTKWDIVGSMAHVIMLNDVGLVSDNERNEMLKALHSLFEVDEKGNLVIENGMEDIHSQIEKEMASILGTTGKKIHTGRSRNDQVLVDIRLYTREEIDKLAMLTGKLFSRLQALSDQYKDVLLPGYTHMQPAMLSSFGLWFGAYAESLCDDILLLCTAREMNNRNPLGTAAGFGTTLPLNRKLTSELLEFDDLLYNSAYASLSRGKVEMAIASALASLAQTLSRFAMDICLYISAEYRFIDFPDEYVTGSSIMPQKRNPDVFELIRGRSNIIQTLPGRIAMLISNLPSGYNRDLQLLKEIIFDAFEDLSECIEIMLLMLRNIKVRRNITENPLYNTIFSTEEVNRLVKEGIPFRDAYKAVADLVKNSSFSRTSVNDYVHEGSIGNLCNREIAAIFNARMKCFSNKTASEMAEKMMSYVK
ncbi:MAG TPA: argininosuccinate lyase [Bacteroidales bacterium]|nr:argininosuccinate lyase [Bacteroidales bacterium]HPF01808.1 argininosuccinate lyase [Bacteroidales bacterium]HPJ59698.1 argininosuccinate lyase [Bacteroidales bacterium]HPR11329.1 argininosuccinate lyase [Bacteroidales bacterium]HRW86161.1 argininosuccinate lyase [Bacteroidales bacterium]